MSVLPDWQIQRDVKIEPFAESLARPGIISYGVSSYGYDVRVGSKYKVFTNVHCAVVDPKKFDPTSFVDIEGDSCLIPPNSFALAETIEYLEIPRDVIGVCVGKCVSGTTRVVDATTGDYLPIRDFVARKGQRTVGLHRLRLEPSAVSEHRHSGIEPVYELTTWTGQKIRATATHPFRTSDGWKELGRLAIEERIAVARTCPVFGQEDMPDHEATLLGFLLADGPFRTSGSRPRYTTGDPYLAEVFTQAAREFGCDVRPVGDMGYDLVNRRGTGGVTTHDRVHLWLEKLGCAVKSIDRKVPGALFRARPGAVAAFLRALFSGDGSSCRRTPRKGTLGVTVEYASRSETLIRDIHHLLLRFGVFSLVRSRLSSSGRRTYRIRVTNLRMLRRFADRIGFVPGCRKQATFDALLAERGGRSNLDTIPLKARELSHRTGRSLRGIGVGILAGQAVSRAPGQTVARATDHAGLAEADVVWDRVRSIEPAGVEAVYDLSVPGAESFLANDLVVHNSTYARCGIIVNVTPLEPEWCGKVTIEISNTTPLPAKIYSGEGIAQILFFRADAVCKVSYGDKQGKYQHQKGLTLPFVVGQEPPEST